MYQQLDQLVNIDYNKRSINHLYLAASQNVGSSLTLKAVEIIETIPADRFVFFATGSVTRSWVTPTIGETDGPLGTAVLAKIVRECRSAIPVILTEESLIETTIPVLKAAGLAVVTPKQAWEAQELREKGYTSVVCILPFPAEDDEAKIVATQLINEMNPAAVICIEKAGKGEDGAYYNMRGHDYSPGRARVDYLVEEARNVGIPTIAVGDGGNEIGMGSVKDAVKEHVPHGEIIASATKTDLLVTASVSNWGCYAICAALALRNKNVDLLPKANDEKRMLEAAVLSGHVDGATGKAETTVDGFSLETNVAMIEMLRAVVLRGLR
ncbi:DUF4392 domain-containing protein [Bacillus subtilis]|uniref:D-glutamate cyclase-like C-terminal domain-containing protein n=1 Tax=Bacillus subtilis subsp. subtilis TaxID=135461 RepID=A0ABD3ZXK1_BACIU|nr:DUF4392 domain-containing protein [Bacillus subtilis]KIL32856.1 hypothetical protein B4067_4709 [Bacillus subtilis subsp. subtilis]KIN57457.1 hypothetical protein B4145_4589 [Bacillus subtilis]